PTVRSFPGAGITGLEALEAPMTITTYDQMRQIVTGPIGEQALSTLEGSGIVGLGLEVGPLRRPFAEQSALVGPDDWQGITFRSYASPIQSATYEALGAVPVIKGFGWQDLVHDGSLRGGEFDLFQYNANGFGNLIPFVTGNVILWPKTY